MERVGNSEALPEGHRLSSLPTTPSSIRVRVSVLGRAYVPTPANQISAKSSAHAEDLALTTSANFPGGVVVTLPSKGVPQQASVSSVLNALCDALLVSGGGRWSNWREGRIGVFRRWRDRTADCEVFLHDDYRMLGGDSSSRTSPALSSVSVLNGPRLAAETFRLTLDGAVRDPDIDIGTLLSSLPTNHRASHTVWGSVIRPDGTFRVRDPVAERR
jgi:hypothetical protein